MVRPLHHATAAKAAKSGIDILADADAALYKAIDNTNTRIAYGDNAPALLADVLLARMLAAEYPKQVKFKQDKDGTWTLTMKGEKPVKGPRLVDLWDAVNSADESEDEEGEDEEGEDEEGEDEEGEDEEGEDEEEDEEGEEESAEGGKSIVKHKYRVAYKPHRNTNGDTLAQDISDHVSSKDENGRRFVDLDKLKKFAIANGVWDDKYALLNAGQQRMNIGNRIRAKVRKGEEIDWS